MTESDWMEVLYQRYASAIEGFFNFIDVHAYVSSICDFELGLPLISHVMIREYMFSNFSTWFQSYVVCD